MKTIACVCPACRHQLILSNELVHEPSGRTILYCNTPGCMHYEEYFVIGNLDNYGDGVTTKPSEDH